MRANVNAMLDRAENPKIMLEQLVRDYTANITEAERALTLNVGTLRQAEDDLLRSKQEYENLGAKAIQASETADKFRAQGDAATAEKFDNLAKMSLRQQVEIETRIQDQLPIVKAQQQEAEQLKLGLAKMKEKLGDLRKQKDEMVSRISVAQVANAVGDTEDALRKHEAMLLGKIEMAEISTPVSAQFDMLEAATPTEDDEIAARFAALKAGKSVGAI